GFESPFAHELGSRFGCLFHFSSRFCCHVAATRTQHLEDALIWIAFGFCDDQDRLRDVPAMVLRYVDVDHRLVDPLVPEPGLKPPRIHAEQRSMRSERVALMPTSA
ncbi:MAG: hypothetical protein ABJE66_30400, partial [Deltaproteobacteria bacterium]